MNNKQILQADALFADVMVDIETTGTGPDAAIISIGAVAFDRAAGVLGPFFYTTINLASAIATGGQVDADTMTWWMKQSEVARAVFTNGPQLGLCEALDTFTAWLHDKCAPREQIRLWGNGADFDPVILAATYRRIGVKAPWDFWNTRCFRTVRGEHKSIAYERTGTAHNALDDAISQALHMLKIDAANSPTPQQNREHTGALTYPAILTEELKEALGMICFQCAPIAHVYRDAGLADIPAKAEAEQAFVIDMLIRLVIGYGADWRMHAQEDLNRARAIFLAKKEGTQ